MKKYLPLAIAIFFGLFVYSKAAVFNPQSFVTIASSTIDSPLTVNPSTVIYGDGTDSVINGNLGLIGDAGNVNLYLDTGKTTFLNATTFQGVASTTALSIGSVDGNGDVLVFDTHLIGGGADKTVTFPNKNIVVASGETITSGTIDYTATSSQVLFTNNTANNFMITSVSAETLTATNVTVEPQATLQANGGSWDLVAGASLDTAIASGVVNQIRNVDVAAGTTFNILPGDSATLTITTAGTADAYTGRIIISGIYY